MVDYSVAEGLKNVGLASLGKSPKYLIDNSPGVGGYSVTVEPGKKIVGFYALLRTPFQFDLGFGGGGGTSIPGLNGLAPAGTGDVSEVEDEKTIMALGIVTFD